MIINETQFAELMWALEKMNNNLETTNSLLQNAHDILQNRL